MSELKTANGWFTPHVRNPEKYDDCRTDLMIGGGGNTLPRAANTLAPPLLFPSCLPARMCQIFTCVS